MVDVSAQASCTVTPISPTNLTAAGGVLPNGTKNVMIQCNCSEDDGSEITNVRWYGPDGITVPRTGIYVFTAGAPYYARPSGDSYNRLVIPTVIPRPVITLVIPTFNDSYDGNYTCGKRNGSGLVPPIVAVNLTIDGKLFIKIIRLYVYLNVW